ncbi:hypothetical protein BT96DRAFT_960830 [Gymnopus androsaceus JB14]|uniref:Uncharacterized protein n=1 Tax=Gymnopus androsaceus JB14 TaxID=1447944 RepID=A0A6A4GI75_9AGAR|nr:hypothetical protein BT96DRAFT_960830 [Gymnopus androsaceus JB14]
MLFFKNVLSLDIGPINLVRSSSSELGHLKELKRGGRGNDGVRNMAETKIGELAVSCITCPAPGINLPEGWENAPPDKHCEVSTWALDPPLGDSWSYFYCATIKDQEEICTCTGLAALDYANTKYSKGYCATGVGMCTCSHHEVVMKNGVGDLQKGER